MGPNSPAQKRPIFGELDPRFLLHYAVLDEGNVAITGLPDADKIALVKTALKHLPEGFAAVVFDTARDYDTDVCNEYGVFSVDVGKLMPLDVVATIVEAFEAVYGTDMGWTPAMAELLMDVLESGAKLAELSERVLEVAGPQEQRTAAALRHRMRHFQYPHFGDAPRLDPKPGVVTCVDMHNMSLVARVAYVLFALQMLEERRNIFYIIDEAHIFMRTRRASIVDTMRVSRHNMQLFVLTTRSIDDIWGGECCIKIYVRFPEPDVEGPQWEEPHKALVTIYVTNERAAEALPGRGVLRNYLLAIKPPT